VNSTPDLPSSFRLDGRVAVVVGGTGALGGRMAQALAGAGASA
jgi:NAD(P)-dependent dehydrogenase (short-subunit alcohol dehydrogenase family)